MHKGMIWHRDINHILTFPMSQWSVSGRRMSCNMEQKRTWHLGKEKPRAKLQVWKSATGQQYPKSQKPPSLTMALTQHNMLSERLRFWFEEVSLFKQNAAHTAIQFISQDRCIWQCVLRNTFFPLVMWDMAFIQVWNDSHCNKFFSTFLMVLSLTSSLIFMVNCEVCHCW